jgi:hypothetical protein
MSRDAGGARTVAGSPETPAGWVAVVLEKPERGGPVLLTYCPDCAVQFEDDDVRPLDCPNS